MLFLFFLLFSSLLNGKDILLDTRINYPATEHFSITPRVNVVNGEYLEEEIDLVVAGSQPLSIRRFYGHNGGHHRGYNHWRFNPEHYCVANFCYDKQTCFVSVGDASGAIGYYGNRAENLLYTFSIDKCPGFVHPDQNGQTHPLNTKISFELTDGTRSSAAFRFEGVITTGNGSQRKFKSAKKPWVSKLKLPIYPQDRDYGSYVITPQVWTPYEIPIIEERLPNGNIIEYTYDFCDERRGFQEYILLKSITAYNSLKTKTLGKLTFDHIKFAYRLSEAVITGSDQRKVTYKYDDYHRGHPFLHRIKYLASVKTPHLPEITYKHLNNHPDWQNKIESVRRGEDEFFTTKYDDKGRVEAQFAPVGPKGEMLPIARYTYGSDFTKVTDAEDNDTIHRFDATRKMTSVEIYEKKVLYSIETYKWHEKTGNLLLKTLKDSNRKLILEQEFDYDKNQNLIFEKISDEKGSYTIYRSYSDDGFNLPLQEWDDFDKKIVYTYVPNTNLLKTETIYNQGVICKKKIYEYDDAAILIKTVVEDLSGFQKTIEITPRYSLPCFGLPEMVAEKINGKLVSRTIYSYTPFGKIEKEEHYDSDDHFCYAIVNEYDARERLKSTTDPLSHKTTFTYDEYNNRRTQTGPRSDYYKVWDYDKARRPISETLDGLTCKMGYDKLGRLIWIKDESDFETRYTYDVLGRVRETLYADGTRKQKEYDLLGNIIKEIDGNGYETTHEYNFRRQPIAHHYPDGTHKFFTYRADGRLEESTDRNASTKHYTYDVYGNVAEEKEGERIKIWHFLGPLLQSEEDACGYLTVYKYDDLGRKKSETKGDKTTTFSYDALGRVTKATTGNIVQAMAFDFMNQCLEKAVKEPSGKVFEKQCFAFDELGNQTHVITSGGEEVTRHNVRGQPIEIKDPLGAITTISYSYLGGKIETITNPKGIQSVSVYDCKGKVVENRVHNKTKQVLAKVEKKYDAEGNLKEGLLYVFENTNLIQKILNTWTYGPCNRLETIIEGGKKKSELHYDIRGRLWKKIKPDGAMITYEYDDCGRLKKHFSTDFEYQYSYDNCDRVTEIIDSKKPKIIRDYDEQGFLISETLANGLSMSSLYDEEDLKRKTTLPDKSEIVYTYKGGKLETVTRGNFKHIYSRRDNDGLVSEMILPHSLGKVEITRDAKGRWKTFKSAYHTTIFPEGAYDLCGNLCHYTCIDAQGPSERHFTYDDLDQLTSENEHTYTFDSACNCINKDGEKRKYNVLCQCESMKYDLNGNLESDEKFTYKYDTLDRLIAVIDGTRKITYSYDALNRRIGKEIEGKQTLYIWDDKNEIGSTDSFGAIQELRVLGEGLGAEIGAAVLMEIEGKSYVSLHDHIGNVIALIDMKTGIAVANRYTAFGQSCNEANAPWTYSGKRLDAETGFIYFGRRYYMPSCGRWLTPDPKGAIDGPNLYAYVHNNPLTHFDLYGLKGVLNDLWDYFHRKQTPQESHQGSHRCGHYYPEYEARCSLKSCFFNMGIESIPGWTNIYMNGVNNNFCKDTAPAIRKVSNVTGEKNVEGVHFRSQGLLKDLICCGISLLFGKMPPAAILLKEKLETIHKQRPNDKIFITCHSGAAIYVRNGLIHSDRAIRSKVLVMAVAPGAYIHKDLCLDVRHLTSKGDIVPLLDFKGRRECRETTLILEPHPGASFFNHEFDSKTYEKPMQKTFTDFFNTYWESQ